MLEEGIGAGEVGIWRWDVSAECLFWSRNMEAIHRRPSGSFDGTFQSFTRDVHPGDQARLSDAAQAALKTGESFSIQYRLPPDVSGAIRWIEARGRVERDATGAAISMTGTCQDITSHKEIQAETSLRAKQQEAVAQLGEQALAGGARAEIFGEAVRSVRLLAEADFAEVLELSQDRETLSYVASDGWPEGVAEGAAATSQPNTHVGLALRSNGAIVVSNFATDSRFPCPERLMRHGVQSGACATIAGTEGNIFGVIAVYCRRTRCISREECRFLQSVANVLGSAVRSWQEHERSDLLIGELRHRVGNLFSLVQALHRQTGQSATDARDLEMKFGSRLAALAGAHSLILDRGWGKTSLRDLLKKTLAPYIERVVFKGSDVRLPADSAFSFAMALHELATNANKYGALSSDKGRLVLDSHSEPDALGQKLVLVWNEHDGPPPPEATSEGFGSKLISQVVERQLGGKVTREVEADGLRFTMEFPIG